MHGSFSCATYENTLLRKMTFVSFSIAMNQSKVHTLEKVAVGTIINLFMSTAFVILHKNFMRSEDFEECNTKKDVISMDNCLLKFSYEINL